MPSRSFGEPGPDPIDVAVGLRMRDLRKQRGMSQDQLARSIGVTFQQVQKYERGTNRISASMLVKAARILEVGAAALLPAEEDSAPMRPRALNVLATVWGADALAENYGRVASPQLRRSLLQLVRTLAAAQDN